MKRLFLFIFFCSYFFLPSTPLLGQETDTYIVIARPSHLIRTEPSVDAPAISDKLSSVVYGASVQVMQEKLQADTIEGIPGNWRQVKNKSGKLGYMFDGYLVKRGAYLPASDQYGFERHERKIEGLNNQLEESQELLIKAQRSNQQMRILFWIFFPLLLIGCLIGFYFLRKYLKDQFENRTSFKTEQGTLNMKALVAEVAPKVSAQLDPKIKKISPNIIDLIQIQLKEFNEKMGREYQKKTHVKTIKIKREEIDVDTQATPKTEKAEKIEQNKFGFSEDTALFSAYLHKGYQRRYVELPRNNLFFGRKATPEVNENSVYELCVLEKDPTRALYRMIDSPDILEKALRFPHDYIYPVCEVFGTGNIQEAEQLEYSYGIAVKDEANWRIIQKAKLRYYLSEQLEEEAISETAWQPTGEDTTAIFYAVAPKNEIFQLNGASEQFESGKHVFKITVTEQDKATYEIVDDKPSQIKAFHLPNKYLLPAFATLGQGSIYVAERAEMVQAGELKFENGEWKIAKKGIIQFFKS